MFEIRQHITRYKIWELIDETTDAEGRYISKVIIGTLLLDGPGEMFLLTMEVLKKANFSNITKLFYITMFLLWPNSIRQNNVLIFLSNVAPYMKKAGETIKVLYSEIINVTYLTHGLYRVTKQVCVHYPKVDKLVSSVKLVFLKTSSRNSII